MKKYFIDFLNMKHPVAFGVMCSVIELWMGINVMYCVAHPEFLVRAPIIAIGGILFGVLQGMILDAVGKENNKEKEEKTVKKHYGF